MPELVTIDARDAAAEQLRGWGRYARCLVDALAQIDAPGLAFESLTHAARGPEVYFEQVGLPWHLRRRRVALVHSTNCFLPLVRPCAGVVTIHDLAFEAWPQDFRPITRWKYRLLARLAARSAERIIVPSDFTRGDLCRRYGIEAGKIRVIPEAPALPLGSDPPPPGPYVLAVGDLRGKKNLDVLVRALRVLRERERLTHRLVLVGVDTGAGQALRGQAGSLPLELTGYVSDTRLDALIRGAEVLVHPSRYEGFGLVVLEAMARGTPVIAARATALPQTGGQAAAYFSGDGDRGADALATVLAPLLRDSGARTELARRGREHAAAFSWARTARETVDVYRELV